MNFTEGLKATGNIVQETPQAFFDWLNGIFRFDLDVCALPENAKCDKYYTPESDGLRQPWTGGVWCNPPYGREISKWVEKAVRERERESTTDLSLCCSRHGQTPSGSKSMCTARHFCGSWMAVCRSGIRKAMLRFRVYWPCM